MNIQQAKESLPPGWGGLVDTLFVEMEKRGVPEEKLIEVKPLGGYAVFFYAPMPIKMFDDIRESVYLTEMRSITTCCVCGSRIPYVRSGSMPFCDAHGRSDDE